MDEVEGDLVDGGSPHGDAPRSMEALSLLGRCTLTLCREVCLLLYSRTLNVSTTVVRLQGATGPPTLHAARISCEGFTIQGGRIPQQIWRLWDPENHGITLT